MKRVRGLRRFFRLPPSPETVAREVDDELEFHLRMRIEELERAGRSSEEARAEALRRFGDVGAARSELRDIDRIHLRRRRRAAVWDRIRQDIRFALRSAARRPGFAAVVVLTIGLGIGANAAMFGLIDVLLLRAPPHVEGAERLGRVHLTRTFRSGGTFTNTATTSADFIGLRDNARMLDGVAAFFSSTATLGRGPEAESVRRVLASGAYFDLLGVRPRLGRFFGEAEDQLPSGSPVAVLSHGFWQRQYGGRADVLGEALSIGEQRYTVIGVAPAGFTGAQLEPVDVFLPLSAGAAEMAGAQWPGDRNLVWLRVLVRLAPGATAEQASAELTSLYVAANEETLGDDPAAGASIVSIVPGHDPVNAESVRVALWLGGVSFLVLLIACANVANLLLGRAMRRRAEVGIRMALGVGQRRLATLLVAESLVLAVAGCVVGLLLTWATGGAVRGLLLPELPWDGGAVDVRVAVFAAVMALIVALATALPPALQSLAVDVTGALKSGPREGTLQRSRTRGALVLVQATLSVVLLVGAGLFVRSLQNVRSLDLGTDAGRVLAIGWPNLWNSGYSAAEREAIFADARERLAALPGVEDAAVAMTVPFWSSASSELSVPGLDSLPEAPGGGPYVNGVTPEYFRTVGTAIVGGRGFRASDVLGAPRVAIVSETMARVLWPGEDAIGKCIRVGADTVPCSEVVGIAEDVRYSLSGPPVMLYYLPMAQRQRSIGLRALFVRTSGDPASVLGPVREAAQRVRPDLPYAEIRLLSDIVEPHVRPWRLGATLFGGFGALALLLAALGLYAVVAYAVAQRTQELGVRVAIGASAYDVVRLVLAQSLRTAVAGIAIGLAIAWVAGSAVEPLLFEQSARDPIVLGTVAVILLAVGILASLVPVARALRIDPVLALKAE
jgi:predicted permease